MEDIEQLVKRWGDYGLLEELSLTQKPIAAMLYERMAQHIVGLDLTVMSSGEKRTETVIFPIIYRIVKRHCKIDSIVPLYNEVVQYFNRHETEILECEAVAYNRIDAEAEYTAQFCEAYIDRYRDPMAPSKNILRWKK
jgi:hypothetical protein